MSVPCDVIWDDGYSVDVYSISQTIYVEIIVNLGGTVFLNLQTIQLSRRSPTVTNFQTTNANSRHDM